MKKTYLSVNNISKEFNGINVIKNLSFEVNKGELVKISGKNGSGKSTLIKILAQLYFYDKGEIKLIGEDLKSSNSKTIISYCSSDFIFYKDLNVKNNILFYFGIIGELNSKILYEKNKNFLGLNIFENKYPDELSNGQKKKMNLFRSLVPSYDLYLLDEPELGLDLESLDELDKKLQVLINNKKTIIFSTHNNESLSTYLKFKKEILL
ncbi:MAG: ATP-binding cassette domain-containing protein [Dehalococcoidales bacterium]|jgi:ABC-2 type transport system ATP-binding protein|nr:ATP-binding cassette domain-containing protein [Dehalococcoidia bacterium]NCG35268.1 ATP-binding cassette domain-containing protein [Dehalococcoidales bacterium]